MIDIKVKKPDVEDVEEYPVDDFLDDRCFREEEHQGTSKATVNLGTRRETIVTELCIFCNVRLAVWREYPTNFTF